MSFAHQGYAIVNDVFSEADLLLARELVAHLVARHRKGDPAVIAESISVAAVTRQHPQRNPGIISEQVENEPFIIGNLIALDSRFARLFCIASLWTTASKLLECAREEVVFHFSNVTRKPPLNGPAIGWHRDADNSYFASVDHRTLRLLLPLQHMSGDNGGTQIVASSHLPGATHDDLISVPAIAPGSCLVLHSMVRHGGSPNRSNDERDVIVLQFGVISSELRHKADELLALSGREAFVKFIGN